MSLPKSRILSNSKGLAATAEFHNNSPEQSTVVNVNLHSSPQAQPQEDPQPQPQQQPQAQPQIVQPVQTTVDRPAGMPEANPYAAILEPGQVQYVQERSVETAKQSTAELEAIIHSKDNVIEAYSLMLDIVENNPLIINKYVVADIDSLTQLITYLTEAERVDIQKSMDVDCSCIGQQKYTAVEKIYITKQGETQNFKYSYPSANKILDDHHISVKFVATN